MNILMITPDSPPKSSPESIQVGRYLQELDRNHNIVLVNTPIEAGWVSGDKSLELTLERTKTISLSMFLHKFMVRLFSSKYFQKFAIPDKDFWIKYKASYVLSQITQRPDVLYSRSLPFSSALLALRIKRKTNLPWIMHLSDPIYDNPYRIKSSNDNQLKKLEYACFTEADFITVTTDKMSHFYKEKYPSFSDKIKVSPNVMPSREDHIVEETVLENDKLTLIYAGALYGKRNLKSFLDAMNILRNDKPQILKKINIKIIGNIAEDIKKEVLEQDFGEISLVGRMNYKDVLNIQDNADIMISIEPDGNNPILKSFLPSKILDFLAANKPILSLTPKESESWDICNKYGFGWAVEPNDSQGLARLLFNLVMDKNKVNDLNPNYEILQKYTTKNSVSKLVALFNDAMKKSINE